MEHDQGAGRHLEGNRRTFVRPGRGVEGLDHGTGTLHHETLPQRAAVAAGFNPQASVVQIGILEREPERGHRLRRGVEEGGVLVPADLAADTGLLEDVHRLPDQGLGQPSVPRHLRQRFPARELVEHRVEVMHRVADLVDRQRLVLPQFPVRVEGLFLEEAAHLVGRAHEVGVDLALLLVGGEDGAVQRRSRRRR
ncbi:MAG: hypothetical protein V9F46_06100 [Chitinophagaceae bacterium]